MWILAGKVWFVGAMLIVGSGLLSAQTGSKVSARILAEVNSGASVPLRGNAMIARTAEADLGAAPADLPLSKMMLLLEPSAAQNAELAKLTEAQTDPRSPLYHQWLTPGEYGARFGIADEDIEKVTGWLLSQGFSIDDIPVSRRLILFSGTNAQLSAAFHTSLHHFRVGTTTRLANDADPEIPSAFAPVISGLVSLNDAPRSPAHTALGTFSWNKTTNSVTPKSLANGTPLALAQTSSPSGSEEIRPQFTTTIGTATYKIVAPYDFATIYDLKSLWDQGYDGAGQTIAIISPSDMNLSDVDSFRAQFGLPAKKVNKIFVGPNPGITANVDETALDVEWSGAIAKGATIDLVVAGSTATSDGVDLAAVYIVNNNLAPVVSLSYGACEFGLGASGNAFYNALWQQAAAQGQSVFVAAGDAGSTTCDQGSTFSTLGLSVNGLGSTPYNVSVGGTDLYGSYSSPSTYWNSTNDSTTLASALSYVPEVPWNDSCGNPVLLSVLQSKGSTYTSTAAACASYTYHNVVGGGGGVSSCITNSNGTITGCNAGYSKPSWQAGSGVPADGVRDLPDVSLFAGDGLWGSFYPYCLSQANTDGTCNEGVSTDIQGAGGTSFASPAFAGILAIVNQKTGSIQGNPNPIFYQLAATQTSLDCSATGTSNSSGCIFHDLTTGGNATPCYNYVGAKDCQAPASTSIWGVVSGYAAGKGYDPASGLGSVDITNLINAWTTATGSMATTTTTMSLSSTVATYGLGPTATVTVTSANSGTPTGLFSVLPASNATNSTEGLPGTLNGGSGKLALPFLPVGSYAVHAHYAGDTGFNASDSSTQTVTIAQAATTISVSPSRTSLTSGQSATLLLTVAAAGAGDAPTGSVHVIDSTNAVDLGTVALSTNSSGTVSSASLNVSASQLLAGSNALTVTYLGDTNYMASSATQAINFTSPMALTLSTASISMTTGATATSATSKLAVAAANGGALAYPITLTCAGILPAGASCGLSSTLLASPSTTAVVTITYNPIATIAVTPAKDSVGNLPRLAIASLAGVTLLCGLRRRRLPNMLMVLVTLFAGGLVLNGCAGSSTPSSSLTLTSSASTANLGSSVGFTAVVTGSGISNGSLTTGSVALTDTYHGSSRSAGTITLVNGQGSLSTSALGLGTHSIVGVFSGSEGYPASTSSATTVAVSASATLQITAIDARGFTVITPLQISFQ